MMVRKEKQSGRPPFSLRYRPDLSAVPAPALRFESLLHGGFAADKRPGYGDIYFGMPACGLIRVSPDLSKQEIIRLSPALEPVNFHSTRIGEFDGKVRLILAANLDAMVAVLTLEGDLDFILPTPEFDEYRAEEAHFRPTDTVAAGNLLFVADGYGANYITTADLSTRRWTGIFGGKTEKTDEHGKFGTAHGINRPPVEGQLAVADRPLSRIEIFNPKGQFLKTHALPDGARPCGVDYLRRGERWYAAVASLDDPAKGRPAPIYILDAETYEIVSIIRPKEELGVEAAEHIHNVIWHEHDGQLYLICQSWNPGSYFVLAA